MPMSVYKVFSALNTEIKLHRSPNRLSKIIIKNSNSVKDKTVA